MEIIIIGKDNIKTYSLNESIIHDLLKNIIIAGLIRIGEQNPSFDPEMLELCMHCICR